GQLLEAALRKPLRLVVHERPRHQPRPAVRARDELHGRLAVDGIDRHPHRAVLGALDVVVRLVLVPGRGLACTRLLDEQVVVEEPDLPRAHQLARDRGRWRRAHELLELRDPRPVAEVLEEAAWIVWTAGDERPLARLGEVPLDAPFDQGDLVRREGGTYAD